VRPKAQGRFKTKDNKFIPKGIYTAMVTPFTESRELDKAGVRRLVEWQIKGGIHGVVVTAGCGEFVNLTDTERKQVLDIALETAAGRVPVVAGILAASTGHALDLAKNTEKAGASAALVLTPYYVNPSAEGIYKHFAAIADKTSIPIILYNNPGRTKIDLDLELLSRLADIPTVVGLKECQRDIGWVIERVHHVGDRIAILAGDDDMTVPMYFFGGQGDIAVTTQIGGPEPVVEMWDALEQNNIQRAMDIHFNFAVPILWTIFRQNHPAPIKKLMAMTGHSAGPARLPLEPPSDAVAAQMKEVADKALAWYAASKKKK